MKINITSIQVGSSHYETNCSNQTLKAQSCLTPNTKSSPSKLSGDVKTTTRTTLRHRFKTELAAGRRTMTQEEHEGLIKTTRRANQLMSTKRHGDDLVWRVKLKLSEFSFPTGLKQTRWLLRITVRERSWRRLRLNSQRKNWETAVNAPSWEPDTSQHIHLRLIISETCHVSFLLSQRGAHSPLWWTWHHNAAQWNSTNRVVKSEWRLQRPWHRRHRTSALKRLHGA